MQYDPLANEEETYLEGIDGEAGSQNRLTDEALTAPLSTLNLRDVVCLECSDTVEDAIGLMRANRFGCVVATSNGRLAGIFTERDALMKAAGAAGAAASTMPLADVMTANPESLRLDHPIGYALNLMSEGGYRHIPLIDADGRPVHVVSVRDIVAHIAEYFPEEVKNLPPDPDQTAGSRHGG